MHAEIRILCKVRTLVILALALLLPIWLTPVASAQTVTMPSSVDNNTPINPGDTIEAGFQVEIADTDSGGTTVSVTSASARVSVSCPNGGSQTITINVPAQSIHLSGYKNGWSPSNDNTYQGKAQAPSNLCGGKQGRMNGTIFTATFGQKCDNGDNNGHEGDDNECCHVICFRFHDRCNHQDGNEGGSWDDDDESCKQQKQCMTSQHRNNCNCKDTDHDQDARKVNKSDTRAVKPQRNTPN